MVIEKSQGWCCENCGRLIKGDCENNGGVVECLKCYSLKSDVDKLFDKAINKNLTPKDLDTKELKDFNKDAYCSCAVSIRNPCLFCGKMWKPIIKKKLKGGRDENEGRPK